jgi:hypothetical protein
MNINFLARILIDSQELLADKLEALFASHGASVVIKADVQIDTLDLFFKKVEFVEKEDHGGIVKKL